jgi:Domain of unknown function (DUF4124)
MRAALLILLLCAAPALAAQTVWKWVDDKGVVHYSDRPVPGATRIEISTGNRYEPSTPQGASEPSTQESPPAAPYEKLAIATPADGETIVNTGGEVSVTISLAPPLRRTHRLFLYHNGALVEGQDSPTSYTLSEVPRGTHSLIARVLDERGATLQESPLVTFYVRQTSVAQPPVGPTLRPPPKPQPRRTSNKLPAKQPSYADLNGGRPAINPLTNAPVQSKIDKKLPTVPGKSP